MAENTSAGSIGLSFGLRRDDASDAAPELRPGVAGKPTRLVALADFGAGRPSEAALPVDKEGFAAAFATLDVRLTLAVPDRLSGAAGGVTVVEAPVRELADFRADRIAVRVPEIAAAVALRDALTALCGGTGTPAAVDAAAGAVAGLAALAPAVAAWRAAGAAPPAASAAAPSPAAPPRGGDAPPGGDDLDSLLSMVDTPAAAPVPQQARAALDALVGGLVGGGRAGAVPDAAPALARVEAALEEQVAAVAALPRLAEVEAAWRGLKLLVDRADARAGVRVAVASAPREEVVDAFRRVVRRPEESGLVEPPLTLAVLAYEFDGSTADLDRLQAIADDADAIQTPVVVGVGPALFGLSSMADLASLRDPFSRLDGNDRWNALRAHDGARWLVAALNRIRVPARSRDRLPDRLGSPAWALAVLVARSAAATGWPTEIAGPRHALEDLPVGPSAGGGGVVSGLEVPLSIAQAEGFAEAGVLALAGGLNEDRAVVVRAPTVHRPVHVTGGDAAEARMLSSLPYQLLAAEVAKWLSGRLGEALAGDDDTAREERLGRLLARLVADSGPGAGVAARIVDDPDAPGAKLAHIVVRTGAAVLGGQRLTFDVPA
ncbi:type VI secretion system contractile sheath domain-containing protein [Azospirillum sp. ST 5-10]|uniref:type VI secretion system contractile sheath domain-containing protein n=1 Tax=unclassified Azospirillum TaxID=2630922 RepID=UPI003F4A487D